MFVAHLFDADGCLLNEAFVDKYQALLQKAMLLREELFLGSLSQQLTAEEYQSLREPDAALLLKINAIEVQFQAQFYSEFRLAAQAIFEETNQPLFEFMAPTYDCGAMMVASVSNRIDFSVDMMNTCKGFGTIFPSVTECISDAEAILKKAIGEEKVQLNPLLSDFLRTTDSKIGTTFAEIQTRKQKEFDQLTAATFMEEEKLQAGDIEGNGQDVSQQRAQLETTVQMRRDQAMALLGEEQVEQGVQALRVIAKLQHYGQLPMVSFLEKIAAPSTDDRVERTHSDDMLIARDASVFACHGDLSGHFLCEFSSYRAKLMQDAKTIADYQNESALSFPISDKSKVAIYFQMIQLNAAKMKDAVASADEPKLDMYIFDDISHLLENGLQFFAQNPNFLPAGVRVQFVEYKGAAPRVVGVVTGTGPVLSEEEIRCCMINYRDYKNTTSFRAHQREETGDAFHHSVCQTMPVLHDEQGAQAVLSLGAPPFLVPASAVPFKVDMGASSLLQRRLSKKGAPPKLTL